MGHRRGQPALGKPGGRPRRAGRALQRHHAGTGRRPRGRDRRDRGLDLRRPRSAAGAGLPDRSRDPHRHADGDGKGLWAGPRDRGAGHDASGGRGRPGGAAVPRRPGRLAGRGAGPPPRGRNRALHGPLLRQPRGERAGPAAAGHRDGPPPRPRLGRVDRGRGRLSQQHGGPHRARRDRRDPRPRRGRPGCPGRAGHRHRALHAMGDRGRLPPWPPRLGQGGRRLHQRCRAL